MTLRKIDAYYLKWTLSALGVFSILTCTRYRPFPGTSTHYIEEVYWTLPEISISKPPLPTKKKLAIYSTNHVIDSLLYASGEWRQREPMTIYTVQIYKGFDRSMADNIRKEAIDRYAIKTRLMYKQPYYLVCVGFFSHILYAEKCKYDLATTFPEVLILRQHVPLYTFLQYMTTF